MTFTALHVQVPKYYCDLMFPYNSGSILLSSGQNIHTMSKTHFKT